MMADQILTVQQEALGKRDKILKKNC